MIKDNISEVKRRIAAACLRAKRDPTSVKLICVTKNRSGEEIKEAFLAGITEFGENKVQEALSKQAIFGIGQAPGSKLQAFLHLHMLGHLQTNKVKEAVKIFDLIHSVESLRLAEEIDKQAARINKVQDILIEVKTSPETAKSGIKPDATAGLIKEAAEFRNISIQGLMTIAPLADNPEKARTYFRMLRELRDKITQAPGSKLQALSLSMGMTNDFEIAIEEGADMVRIGRAIFEGKI